LPSPTLYTQNANDLIVAFVSSDGPESSFQSLTLRGSGLTWSRAAISDAQAGDAEIWTARAGAQGSRIRVRVSRAYEYFEGSITLAAFTGASVGNASVGAAASGAPSVSLTTSNGSLVWGVGHDWDRAAGRTVASGEQLVDQFTDFSIGDTSWVQSMSGGGVVQLADSAPTNDRWDLAALEIRG
jgi:hypothetical protein